MKTVRLADLVAEAQPGFASGADVPDGVLQVRMHNISRDGTLNFAKERRVPTDARTDRFLLRDNDVLFNATNSPELVGKTALFRERAEPVVFSNHFLRLRVKEGQVDPRYLTRWMQWQHGRGAFSAMAQQWVNQAAVRTERLLRLAVPLPPLHGQRRIARVLDAADRLRATRHTALMRLDALASAHFMASFGDPDENRYGWDVRPVSALVSSFDGGKSFAGEDDDDSQAPYRVLRVSAVTSGEFMPEESRPVPRGYSPPSGHHVRPGDLLISRANTSALVGAVALVDRATDGLLLPDKIWRFSWRDDEAAVPEFVWQLFRTRAIRIAITRRSTGTSGSMKNISAEKLMGIEVIQPPVDYQRDFARVFRHTRRLRAKATRQLSDLDALFASLQHRAFTGAL